MEAVIWSALGMRNQAFMPCNAPADVAQGRPRGDRNRSCRDMKGIVDFQPHSSLTTAWIEVPGLKKTVPLYPL